MIKNTCESVKNKLFLYFKVAQITIFEGIKWRRLHIFALLFSFMWHNVQP